MQAWQSHIDASVGQRHHFKDRQILATKGARFSHVGLLLSGAVEIAQSHADGLGVVVKILKAPAFFGVIEALNVEPRYLESVVSFGEGEWVSISQDVFRQILQTDPMAAHEAYLDLSIAFAVAAKFESFAMFENEARLANLLLAYFEADAKNDHLFTKDSGTNHNLELHVRRNQDDFAAGIGTSLRTINRIIKTWKSDRLLEKVDGRWVCYHPEKLKEISCELYGGLVHQYRKPDWLNYK